MGFTIDFDRQPGRRAIEVEDIWTGSMLLSKPQACGVRPKCKPEGDFRRRHRPAQALSIAAGLL
jgi:hypothetical protein